MDLISLQELRDEHATQVIGPKISALLSNVVRATAPRYPARDYSPSSVWDRMSMEDALHDWIEARLLNRSDLTVLLEAARSPSSLKTLLIRSFTQHLVNRRRRTTATNLFGRTAKTLRSDADFELVHDGSTAGDSAYQLAARASFATSPATPESVKGLVTYAGTRTDSDLGVVRYGPYSLKSSPILRAGALTAFLRDLLQQADGYLTVSQIFAVVMHRFNLVEPDPISLDDLEEDTRSIPAAIVPVESAALARGVAARLGPQQAHRLRLLADADGDIDVAARQGTAAYELLAETTERVQALIADVASDPEEAATILRLVVESLYAKDDYR